MIRAGDFTDANHAIAFLLCDTNQDNKLDREEVAVCYTAICDQMREIDVNYDACQYNNATSLLKIYDLDNSDIIEKDEFVALLMAAESDSITWPSAADYAWDACNAIKDVALTDLE